MSEVKLKGLYVDFKEFINLDFTTTCECHEYCVKEGICRSEKILRLDLASANLQKIAEVIYKKSINHSSQEEIRKDKISLVLDGYDKNLDIYCIERILNKFKLYDMDNWDYHIVNGYYGQEIDKMLISEPVVKEIEDWIVKILKQNSIKSKIDIILNLEYGWLLGPLQKCNYRISVVDKNSIFFPQKAHYKNSLAKNIYTSRSKKAIMGVCLKEDGVYRVVDGYNRLSQCKYKKVRIIEAYEE